MVQVVGPLLRRVSRAANRQFRTLRHSSRNRPLNEAPLT